MADIQLDNIRLNELELGKHEYEFVLDNAFLSAITPSELLGGECSVAAEIEMRESDFTLGMKIRGEVQVACDRCLDPMSIAVDLDEVVEDADETDGALNLPWLAYELIIVNLPLVHSHQPGGCNPQMELLLQSHLCSESEDPEIQ